MIRQVSTQWVYRFGEGDGTMKALLGGKGAGIADMTRAKLPVPPGFTITTAACNATIAASGVFPADLWEQVQESLGELEEATGKRFGDPANPLLVSVRSGAELSAIQQYLNGVAARLDAPADKVHTMMMAYRTPAEAIEIYARNHGADLVVMSTHGRGGLSRLVFGSVAGAVIHATQFPVLVYRPEFKL